ncbi:reeler domain-containing lethal (2) 34Fc [Lycorma delicatula]|uniref:reeler domain-containing lethal (2) 34Fc n=1 Tax=Lycorma delicatula TaxID=130591 RepID=UPI003F5192B1
MAVKILFVVTVLYIGVLQVHAYSTGAPKEVCEDLFPQHAEDPQIDGFPYTIKANTTKIRPSDAVRVTISSDKGIKFKGFIIQARVGDIPVGKFEPAANVKLLDCHVGKKNSATHTSADEKTSVTLVWVAPPKLEEDIKFTATVAKNGAVFWVARKSEKIKVVQ